MVDLVRNASHLTAACAALGREPEPASSGGTQDAGSCATGPRYVAAAARLRC
jgi:hypothetical protein